MPHHYSLYLDLVRVLCAFVVLLSHLGHGHLIGGYLWPFTAFGNEAVMAFFVLSGFVIAYVVDQRERRFAQYAASRLARLYSVILPAMLLTLVLDAIGRQIHAGSYDTGLGGSATVTGYLLSALMLNRSWDLMLHFGSNGAYWSIPYEFWYYVMFGAWMLLNGWTRVLFAVLAALIAGPAILSLLPVWLLGVAVYECQKRFPPARMAAMAGAFGTALLGFMLWHDYRSLGQASFLGMRPDSLAWQYLTGACVALHLYAAPTYSQKLHKMLAWIERPLSFCAESTLALYLFHLPIVALLHAIAAQYGAGAYTSVALLLMPVLLSLTLGRLCERQKRPLRKALLALLRACTGTARVRWGGCLPIRR